MNENIYETPQTSTLLERLAAERLRRLREGVTAVSLDIDQLRLIKERASTIVDSLPDPAQFNPAFSHNDSLAAVVNDVKAMLTVGSSGPERIKQVTLSGRHSVNRLLAELDYKLAQSSVNLPVGNLSSLQYAARQKVATYAKLIASRVFAMQRIPPAEIHALASTLIDTKSQERIKDLAESLGIENVSSAVNVDGDQLIGNADLGSVVELVRNAEQRAVESFVSRSVIQPLLRDVLLKQAEFRWPTVQAILEAAEQHAGWVRRMKRGWIIDSLTNEIFNDVEMNTFVKGLVTLQQATVLGVEQNLVYALSQIESAVPVNPDDAEDVFFSGAVEGEVFTFEPSADGLNIDISSPFIRLERRAAIHNIYGDVLRMADHVSWTVGADERIDSSDIIRAVVALARLKHIDLRSKIDLEFISRFPEWSGLLVGEEFTTHTTSPLVALIPEWVRRRLVARVISETLGHGLAPSPVMQLFMEQNRADLQKSFSSALSVCAMLQRIVVTEIETWLAAVRQSYEWSHLPVWATLHEVGLFEGQDEENRGSAEWLTTYLMTLKPARPLTVVDNHAITATSHFIDSKAVVCTPLLAKLHRQLRDIGALGELVTTAHHFRPVGLGADPTIDALATLSALGSDPQTIGIRREIADAAKLQSIADLVDLATSQRQSAINVTVIGGDAQLHSAPQSLPITDPTSGEVVAQNGHDSELLFDRWVMTSSLRPGIDIHLPLERLTQLPIEVLTDRQHISKFVRKDLSLTSPTDEQVTFVPISNAAFYHCETVSAPVRVPDLDIFRLGDTASLDVLARKYAMTAVAEYEDII